MAQRHGDRLRRGCRAGPQEKLDQRDLQTLFARRRTRHDELQRIVQVGLVDAARDHGPGDLDDVVGHPLHQRRVVGDEPEELGIAEILRAVRLAVARGLDDAFAQEARLGIEKARQPRDIAAPDRRHGSAKRTITDHRAIEQLDDGGLVGGLALFRRGERRPALAVALPFQRAVADQQLDEGKRAARRGGVQAPFRRHRRCGFRHRPPRAPRRSRFAHRPARRSHKPATAACCRRRARLRSPAPRAEDAEPPAGRRHEPRRRAATATPSHRPHEPCRLGASNRPSWPSRRSRRFSVAPGRGPAIAGRPGVWPACADVPWRGEREARGACRQWRT